MSDATPDPAHALVLSPSRLHRRLADETVPALGYDGGDVAAWQARLRPRLAEMMGWDAMPSPGDRPPLRPRTLWRREHELGSIEKIAFAAERDSDAVAYLCLPHEAARDAGAVGGGDGVPIWIVLQGHSPGMHRSIAMDAGESAYEAAEGDRDFALGCMARGMAALCLEQRSFGQRAEREQAHRSSQACHEAAMHALLLGRSLLAERVYDVDRCIDLLESLEAERGLGLAMSRLGCMGQSGGGTVSIYAGAVLERVRRMMPSCSFATFRGSIMRVYHCADNYVPGLLRVAEAADVLGLFAPRPVVVVAGRDDPLFPLPAVEEAFKSLQEIYAAAGAAGRCRLVIGDGGHRFYAEQGWRAMTATNSDI